MTYFAKWDENTEIAWWNEGRKQLNVLIDRVNQWTLDGCPAAQKGRVQRELDMAVQTWAQQDGGSGWLDELKSMQDYVATAKPRPLKLHKTYGVYRNGTWKRNAVLDEDLASHIEYNKMMRFGRALIVDGEVVHCGYFPQEEIEQWARERLPEIDKGWVPIRDTAPYQ